MKWYTIPPLNWTAQKYLFDKKNPPNNNRTHFTESCRFAWLSWKMTNVQKKQQVLRISHAIARVKCLVQFCCAFIIHWLIFFGWCSYFFLLFSCHYGKNSLRCADSSYNVCLLFWMWARLRTVKGIQFRFCVCVCRVCFVFFIESIFYRHTIH